MSLICICDLSFFEASSNCSKGKICSEKCPRIEEILEAIDSISSQAAKDVLESHVNDHIGDVRRSNQKSTRYCCEAPEDLIDAEYFYNGICGRKLAKRTEQVATPSSSGAGTGAWPWMASIGSEARDGRWLHSCGGTVVSTRHILTAAHCDTGSQYVN